MSNLSNLSKNNVSEISSSTATSGSAGLHNSGSGGGGDDGDLTKRVIAIEQSVAIIQSNIENTPEKKDIEVLRVEISKEASILSREIAEVRHETLSMKSEIIKELSDIKEIVSHDNNNIRHELSSLTQKIEVNQAHTGEEIQKAKSDMTKLVLRIVMWLTVILSTSITLILRFD